VDTRTATGGYAGRIVAGAPRQFNHNFDLIAQTGGVVSSCGIPVDPAAIAVTVTSVSPLAAGNLIGYQTGLATPPTTSINNYAVVTGLALANTTILPTGQLIGTDFVLAVNGGSVHAVVDVVGYFWNPTGYPTAGQAHARVCNTTLSTVGRKGFTALTNPATGTYCLTPSAGVDLDASPAIVTIDYSCTNTATQVAHWRSSGIGCPAGDVPVFLWNSATGAAMNGGFSVFVP
jgi:hypothetical protein